MSLKWTIPSERLCSAGQFWFVILVVCEGDISVEFGRGRGCLAGCGVCYVAMMQVVLPSDLSRL